MLSMAVSARDRMRSMRLRRKHVQEVLDKAEFIGFEYHPVTDGALRERLWRSRKKSKDSMLLLEVKRMLEYLRYVYDVKGWDITNIQYMLTGNGKSPYLVTACRKDHQ